MHSSDTLLKTLISTSEIKPIIIEITKWQWCLKNIKRPLYSLHHSQLTSLNNCVDLSSHLFILADFIAPLFSLQSWSGLMGGQVNAMTPLKDVIECQVFNPLYKVLNMPCQKEFSLFYKKKKPLNVGSFCVLCSNYRGSFFSYYETQFCTFTGK